MNDFGYIIQNIEKNIYKKNIFIIFFVIFIVSFALFFAFTYIKNNGNGNKIIIIKSEVSSIKKLSAEDEKNLKLNIYNIVNNEKKEDISLFKTQNIIKNEDVDAFSIIEDKRLLEDKINEIVIENEGEISKIEKSIVKVVKEEKPSSMVSDIKKIGNKSLMENIKNNKDIKPSEFKVQLIALSNRDNIVKYWENIKEKYPNLLDSKNYYIEQNDKSSVASLYKLQLGSFENENDANGFCNEYIKITNKSKIDCIVVK